MENIKNIVGQRIANALTKKNYKQKELAAELGITANTVSYFVNGVRLPSIEQIIKISKLLNVSTDYLLGLTDAQTTDTKIQDICNYTGLSEKAVNELHYTVEPDEEMPIWRPFPALNSFIENDRYQGFFETFLQYCYSDDCLFIKDVYDDDSIMSNDSDKFTNLIGIQYNKLKTVVIQNGTHFISNVLLLELEDRIKGHKSYLLKNNLE